MNNGLDQIKIEIKQWESEFNRKNNRKPTKEDIKDSEIEDVYLKYWNAKRQNRNVDEQNIWGTKFNKTENSNDKKASFSGIRPTLNPKSVFSEKLWKRSQEFKKNDAADSTKRVHVYSPVYHQDINIKSQPSGTLSKKSDRLCNEVKQSSNTEIHDVTLKSADIFGSSNSMYDAWKISSSKLKFCGNRLEPLSTQARIENSKIDINWLNKCITDSVDNFQPIETVEEESLNTSGTESRSTDKCGNKSFWNDNENDIAPCKRNEEIRTTTSELYESIHPNVTETKKKVSSNIDFNTYLPESESKRSDCSESVIQGTVHSMKTITKDNQSSDTENFISTFNSCSTETPLKKNAQFESTSINHGVKSTVNCKRISNAENSRSDFNPNAVESVLNKNNNSEQPSSGEQLAGGSALDNIEAKRKTQTKKRKAVANVETEGNDSEVSKPPSKRNKSNATSGALVSENFVKINIQRKRFTRGPQKLKSRQLKHMAWKKKKWASNAGKCFSCGKSGHWSQNCPKKDEALLNEEAKLEAMNSTKTSGDNEEIIDNPLPTLIREPIPKFDDSSITQNLVCFLKKFKHKEFRPFQEETMRRILSGQSTLLVLPTGSGKSLCYQIPACVYAEKSRCITLVISPLISLMEDQVKNLPSFMKMVCLHSGLNPAQRQHSLDALKSGEAQVLLIAPESLIAMHAFMRSALPPVAFACIDEAHCLSEWSHNFRPSYLQVLKVLRGSLDVHCILGLSATVTRGTVNRISALFEVNPEDAVFGEPSIPSNLQLSISRERDKDKALIELLSLERFQELNSIIIYCTRRETTERLATNIRIHFQNAKTQKDKKVSVAADQVSAYHAGMSAALRKSAQKKFMTGKLRIVVATVAFGMGLNKADVRSVIHFDLPKTFESYTQEIGRAGRDGLPAYCHLFLQPQAKDLDELKRHIYSNGVDRHAVRKLLDRIFRPIPMVPVNEPITEVGNRAIEVAIPVEDIVQTLDVKKENIETLLCYLELHPKKWFEILPAVNDSCTIQCYGGPQQLEGLAIKCKPVEVAFSLSSTVKDTSKVKFSIVEVCSLMKWDFELVRKELRNLQFASVNGVWRRTGILVEFGDPSFHLRLSRHVTADERDSLLNFIHGIASQLQQKELRKLNSLFQAFKKFSGPSCCLSGCEDDSEASEGLKAVLYGYFRDSHVNCEGTVLKQEYNEDSLRAEIRSFLDIHHENRFNARQVAQIFYGIGSPQFPAEVWGKVRRFWRSHLHIDFPDVLAAANQEVVRFRS